MTGKAVRFEADGIEKRIVTIRGLKVILDSDLAAVYEVEVRRLNEQVKRNSTRFPEDFAFRLNAEEWEELRCLRSQNAILNRGRHRKYLPRVFTEHGALMAANVLNSPRAVEMSVFVVRAFVRMRMTLSDTGELAGKLVLLESDIRARLDTHDAAIVDILQRMLDIIDPPPLPGPPKKRIGFGVKESASSLSTIRRLGARSPLPSDGSTRIRTSGASVGSVVKPPR